METTIDAKSWIPTDTRIANNNELPEGESSSREIARWLKQPVECQRLQIRAVGNVDQSGGKTTTITTINPKSQGPEIKYVVNVNARYTDHNQTNKLLNPLNQRHLKVKFYQSLSVQLL